MINLKERTEIMKPLSSRLYSKRNKKKVLASVNAVMLAVLFLYVIYTFTETLMSVEKRNVIAVYKKAAVVRKYEQNPIAKQLISDLGKNENIEGVIPTKFDYGIKFAVPGISDMALSVPIRPKDRAYFMDKMGIKLIEGDLPREGQKEIAVNKDIVKNRKLKIGDKVGDGVNKFDNLPGEYVVVGILDSEALVSILSVNNSIYPNYKDNSLIMGTGFYVFPKVGKKDAMDKYLAKLPEDKVIVSTKATASIHFERNSSALKVIDIIAILSIIVMVVTVGSSKYAQYINRKEELGLLNAMGYNKNQILGKTFKEVVLVNLIGFGLGIILGWIASLRLDLVLWKPSGVSGLLYTNKGLIMAMIVPMFSILFSIIPINNLINKLDPIKMIEKN